MRCAACWALSYSAPAVVNLQGMADVLVRESNRVLLSVCAECMSLLKLGMLPAAPELALCLKSFMAEGAAKERAKNAPGAALMQLHQELCLDLTSKIFSKTNRNGIELSEGGGNGDRPGTHEGPEAQGTAGKSTAHRLQALEPRAANKNRRLGHHLQMQRDEGAPRQDM